MKALTGVFADQAPILTVVPAPEPASDCDDTESRMAVLTALARSWDDLEEDLALRGGLGTLRAWALLVKLATSNAHPGSHPTLAFHLAELHEAVARQQQFETGQLEPWDIVEDYVPGEGRDVVEIALDRELSTALWPLLFGLNVADRCTRCARDATVLRQKRAVTRGLCAEHCAVTL